MFNISNLRKQLKFKSDPKRAKLLQGFFKTGKGEYAEGDVFLGLTVPETRKIVGEYKDLSFKEIQELFKSKIHEERQIALMILVCKYEKASEAGKMEIFKFYLKNTKYINNWDLVDLYAPKIVGEYLYNCKQENYKRQTLNKLAKSKNLWEKRIAMLSTFYFINQKKFEDALKIAKILLNDEHDLIHKAVGWMLREVGKRDLAQEEKFLKKHYKVMPRTMLRYAIEKFPEKKRKMYLNS
ncbi:MAG: DNA alkylation repair protein [Candidatus Paceibacterota bacterium]